ncbi:PREDICTED: hemicentin-1-like, partial [Priapulus caudatus]|uniref:Hemicentin-1-like n=1 Tax=Priapulus caudatus TaxID=37621 RepID=A0ABM1EXK9_PRICU
PPRVEGPEAAETLQILVNDTATIRCPITASPPPVIAWSLNGAPLRRSDNVVVEDGGGRLRIVRVRVADSARYTCTATNVAGSTEKDFDLVVLVPPRIPDSRPGAGNTIVAIVNETMTIDCPAVGHPMPDITWYRAGQPLVASERLQLDYDRQMLRVSGVRLSDTSDYTCEVTNIAGKATKLFDVQIYDAPRIDPSTPTEMQVIQGQQATLPCPAYGVPTPVISWYRHGRSLNDGLTNFKMLAAGAIELEDAQPADSGMYTCVASNHAGNASHDILFTVLVPPTIVRSYITDDLEVTVEDAVTLQCEVKGIPTRIFSG